MFIRRSRWRCCWCCSSLFSSSSSLMSGLLLSSFVLVVTVMGKFANNGNESSNSISTSPVILPPIPSDNFIPCSFNPLCFCKYDQKTEIYESLVRLWQIVHFNRTEYSEAVKAVVQVMEQDPNTIYYVTESFIRSFANIVANSSSEEEPLFQYGPVYDMECVNVPIALIPTEYDTAGLIFHVSLTGSKLTLLDGSAFAGLEIQGIRLSKTHLYSISDYAFSSMSNSLTMLDLSDNSLDEIPFVAFNSLKSLEWLNLSNNKMNSVSGDWMSISRTLRKLILGSNSIESLPYKFFHPFSRLSWLDLSSNFISNVTRESLPPNIQTLNLMKNPLSRFPMSILRCKSLSWLFLRGCSIDAVPQEWNGTPPKQMSQMDLSENLIQVWPSKAFGAHLTVLDLNLRKNFLTTLASQSFLGMNIFHLSLGYNRIRRIDPGVFDSLENSLKYLNLENNRLTEIPWTALNNHTSLIHFYIGLNFIQDEGVGSPEGTTKCKLTHLGLNGNQLSRIPSKVLTQCSRLVHLNLGYNQIAHLDDLALFPPEKAAKALSTLILRNNPIRTLAFINTNQIQPFPNSPYQEHAKINGPGEITTKSNSGSGSGEDNSISSPTNISPQLDNDGLEQQEQRALTSIPNVFRVEVFPNLRELSLSFCQLMGELEPFPPIPLTTLEISSGLSTATELNPGIFQSLRHLEWLALDHNSLHTIREFTFYANPRLNYLNLEWNRLTTLPPQMFHPEIHLSMMHLRLSHNAITVIPSNSFTSFPALNLDLSYNFIHTIEKFAFNEFTPSESAQLSSHANSSNPRHDNPKVVGLNLYLSHNRLTALKAQCFASNKFSLVDLSYNRLKTLNFEAFGQQTIVGGLNVSFNELERVSSPPLRLRLKFLDLSHNRISNVGIDLRTLCVTYLIDLSNNRLEELNSNIFPLNCSVKELNLRSNLITTVDPGSFINLVDLLVLHLEWNQITQFLPITLIRMTKLKYLDLSHNRLRTLPRDSLLGSSLETLDMSWNKFVSIPIRALSQISRRLKRLDISHNSIEHLDSTMFDSISGLLYLNLSSNRLSTLPDNAFANLNSLRELDLSANFLRTNFKELFHFLPKLKLLRLSGCGIKVLPFLPLPHLVTMDLSSNGMREMKAQNLIPLGRLRDLDLSSNELSGSTLPNWTPLHNLATLKLSRNPLKAFTKDTFFGLGRLENLELLELGTLDRFDSYVFANLPHLRRLSVETYPNIEKYRFRLGPVLSNIPHLEELHAHIREPILSDQLVGGILPNLRKLRITGHDLHKIEPGALVGLQNCFQMDLTISQTSIEEIPYKVFESLQSATRVKMDMSDNKISSLDWTSFYPNKTLWFSRGTKIFEGGLILNGNEFICDCDLVWLGEWLRRWLRESFQSHSTDNIPLVHSTYESMKKAVCKDGRSGRLIPLIDLYSDTMCHASALSGVSTPRLLLTPLLYIPGVLIIWFTNIILIKISYT